MYTLPLRFIKVGPQVAICATRIVALMSTVSHQARQTLKQEKRAGTLINAAGRGQTKTAVFLDNGTVIGSPFSVTKLLNDLQKANAKAALPNRANETVRLKVFQAVDEEPPEDYQDEEDLPFSEEIAGEPDDSLE